MPREPKNYEHLIGKVKGLSEAQLRNHFTLYQGYVKKLNEIEQKLGSVDRSAPNYSYNEYSELKRREPVAYNGTFLHELYFDNLGGEGTTPPEALKGAITSTYGSWDNWVADVKAALMSAHGWVITVFAYGEGKIKNNLIQSEHHVGLFVDSQVIVAIDAWEHAYFLDYGTKKADYVTAMLQTLNWNTIGERIKNSPLSHK